MVNNINENNFQTGKGQYLFLENVLLFGAHGAYAEEETLGNSFLIDIKVYGDFSKAIVSDQLASTIDYEQVFEILKEEVGRPVHLLEHLSANIIERLRTISLVEGCELWLRKNNPPLDGQVGNSGFYWREFF
ncbi:MAG TPA: dihydroneopterin aldolase [Saprospiraceae bacterium]|nr:dihydroneopterin aldolase [Saprospiraceae bacterium]